jgi:hypothetical protein
VQEHAGHVPERGLGAAVVVAARAGARDLAVQHLEHVTGQRHDGRSQIELLADAAEVSGSAVDEIARGDARPEPNRRA